MNSVFVVCQINDDGEVTDFVSAHPTLGIALSAERVFRSIKNIASSDRTHVFEVEFSS